MTKEQIEKLGWKFNKEHFLGKERWDEFEFEGDNLTYCYDTGEAAIENREDALVFFHGFIDHVEDLEKVMELTQLI